MKTTEEIVTMLIDELAERLDDIKVAIPKDYYNEDMGDTSFLLAGLLESLLKRNDDWDKSKWFDDSLLTNVILQNDILTIAGVMIWGRYKGTEQWTEPFSFQILISEKSNFKEYTFLFSDKNRPALSYTEFRKNRDYWVANTTGDWKYVISQKVIEEPLHGNR
jgi:hypothetical protein